MQTHHTARQNLSTYLLHIQFIAPVCADIHNPPPAATLGIPPPGLLHRPSGISEAATPFLSASNAAATEGKDSRQLQAQGCWPAKPGYLLPIAKRDDVLDKTGKLKGYISASMASSV